MKTEKFCFLKSKSSDTHKKENNSCHLKFKTTLSLLKSLLGRDLMLSDVTSRTQHTVDSHPQGSQAT